MFGLVCEAVVWRGKRRTLFSFYDNPGLEIVTVYLYTVYSSGVQMSHAGSWEGKSQLAHGES